MFKAFSEWTDLQDQDFLLTSDTWGSWSFSAVFIAAFLLLLTQVSFIQSYTQLQFVPSFLCFVPALTAGYVMAYIRYDLKIAGLTLGIIATSAGIFFFCSALVALAQGSSKFIFASLFFFAAAFYGQVSRTTIKYPFLSIVMLFMLSLGLLIDRSVETLTNYAMMAPIGFYLTTITGSWQVRLDQQKDEREQLREAVMAQLQHEQSTKLQTLRGTLVDILTANHDLNNHLQTVLINSNLLLDMFREESDREDELDMLGDIYQAAKRTQKITHSIRKQSEQVREKQKELELTDLAPTITDVIKNISQRFPSISFEQDVYPESIAAYVSNGTDALYRIFENLLINACQGNGTKNADWVEVRVYRSVSGESVMLEVWDNGPGFDDKILNSEQVKPFNTTKKDGTGIGMYTVEKWIWASGGKFSFENREEGGAIVLLELPSWV